MCTVVARQHKDGWIVTMNRDERRERSEGEPPQVWEGGKFLAPRDPDAGGTWIGARPDGTWACLLNGYIDGEDDAAPPQPATRGRLIPVVLATDDPEAALSSEDLSQTRSFRLWIGDARGVLDCFWDGKKLYRQRLGPSAWQFTTSSSVDQAEVQRVRGAVFAQWIAEGAPHQENGIPALLVDRRGVAPREAIFMERDVSHTKSCTQIRIETNEVSMRHWSADEMQDGDAAALTLSRSA